MVWAGVVSSDGKLEAADTSLPPLASLHDSVLLNPAEGLGYFCCG
jgi:hypothetical protein